MDEKKLRRAEAKKVRRKEGRDQRAGSCGHPSTAEINPDTVLR
jgi:hypothetical protein